VKILNAGSVMQLLKDEPALAQINSNMLKSIVIIPSCNNTAQLLKVLSAFEQKSVNEICVVIDGAGAKELVAIKAVATKVPIPVHVISKRERQGIGLAIKQGIQYAQQNDYDVTVIMAGNGKDQPNEIPRLLKPIMHENAQYVQGSRFLNGGKHVKNPFLRRTFSRLFPYVWTMLTNHRCTDVTNGFRAYRLSLFEDKRININQSWLDDYELEYYIHYKVLTLGYCVKEVPVSKIYPYWHKGGYTNISPLRDWWKIVGPLIYLKLGVKK
jgi:dolichol-phosphate mannosyltransferase